MRLGSTVATISALALSLHVHVHVYVVAVFLQELMSVHKAVAISWKTHRHCLVSCCNSVCCC